MGLVMLGSKDAAAIEDMVGVSVNDHIYLLCVLLCAYVFSTHIVCPLLFVYV